MTLLDQIVPRQEPVAMLTPGQKPKRRGRRKRITAADRRAAQEKLADELRQQLVERNARMTRERDELLVKASELPPGVKIVETITKVIGHDAVNQGSGGIDAVIYSAFCAICIRVTGHEFGACLSCQGQSVSQRQDRPSASASQYDSRHTRGQAAGSVSWSGSPRGASLAAPSTGLRNQGPHVRAVPPGLSAGWVRDGSSPSPHQDPSRLGGPAREQGGFSSSAEALSPAVRSAR